MTARPIPAHARASHAALADFRRSEAARLLAPFAVPNRTTPNEDVQATLALTSAMLAVESRLADLCDVVAVAGGLDIDQGDVAA